MVSSTCCEPAVSGKRFPATTGRAAPSTATSRNGRNAACSATSGNECCDVTTCTAASLGGGRVLTGRRPRRRWAGKKTGKNPTDRGKLGVKRSVLTDGRGMPIGLAVAGANVHDQRLV